MTLSWLILVPLSGSLAAAAAGRLSARAPRWVALAGSLVTAALCATALTSAGGGADIALTEFVPSSATTMWSLALDGLSSPLIALTAFLAITAVLASWKIDVHPGAHHALLLALEAAVMAVFLAANVWLFYVAWEAVLIPMFFLIGVWGHAGRRHAALKFFIYTFAGSALMLVGLIVLYTQASAVAAELGITGFTADIPTLVALGGRIPAEAQRLVFWLIAAGLLVKVPVVPLHTWLPDAHVEAPTAGSMMLAGVLLKMGGYGLIRLALPATPAAAETAGPVLALLGTVGIIYGALMAFAQTDLKRLVAYSSVAHMGFVVLATSSLSAVGITAAMLGMVSHGVVSALLFLLVGTLYERTHTRDLAELGGLATRIPVWSTVFGFGALASLGLPGLSGFPGEFLTVLESFKAFGWWIAPVGIGVVLAAAYSLKAFRGASFGPAIERWKDLTDIRGTELAAAGLLAASIVVLGAWPGLVVDIVSGVARGVAVLVGGGLS